jgi:hypothetical protein
VSSTSLFISINTSPIVGKEQSFQQAQEGVGQTLSQNRALREQRAQETTVTGTPKDEHLRLDKEKQKVDNEKRKKKKSRRKPLTSDPSEEDLSQEQTTVDIVV